MLEKSVRIEFLNQNVYLKKNHLETFHHGGDFDNRVHLRSGYFWQPDEKRGPRIFFHQIEADQSNHNFNVEYRILQLF